MSEDEFTNFRLSLSQINKFLPDDDLKISLKKIFEEHGIPELTDERRKLVRKCQKRLTFIARLSDEYNMSATFAEGVYQPRNSYLTLCLCTELNTLVLKNSTYFSGVSRWDIREESYSYYDYLSLDAAAELIVKYKNFL